MGNKELVREAFPPQNEQHINVAVQQNVGLSIRHINTPQATMSSRTQCSGSVGIWLPMHHADRPLELDMSRLSVLGDGREGYP